MSDIDVSLCVKKTEREIVLILIYVDDLIITRDSDADICDVKLLFKKKFEIKDSRAMIFLGY